GRVLNARVPFRPGEVIFEERPLHIVTEDSQNEAFKLVRRLCRQDPDNFFQEPLWYWAAVCSLTSEQVQPGPKKGSLPRVTADQQRRLLCLYHEPVDEASEAVERLVRELRLNVSAVLLEELLQAWILNCFDHSEAPQGYAAYFGSSFMSHSCQPNAIWHFAEGTSTPDTFVLVARRDIASGDEVCISYVSERVLLQSSSARKKELQSSKKFICTCERCGPGAALPDQCRGFRCPHCGQGVVFHPGPLRGGLLSEGVCPACGRAAGKLAEWLLEEESWLHQQLNGLDESTEKKRISSVLTEKEVQLLLARTGDGETGSVGLQHWLCDRLWGHLADWYDQTGRREDARRMMRRRVDYQRRAFQGLNGEPRRRSSGVSMNSRSSARNSRSGAGRPSPARGAHRGRQPAAPRQLGPAPIQEVRAGSSESSCLCVVVSFLAELAWTLESQADMLLRHLGVEPRGKRPPHLDEAARGRAAAQALPLLEEATATLRQMFGELHEYHRDVERKRARLSCHLSSAATAPPAPPA
ncbi:unnamed protein product, partial [Prorocentrum cordatum]